MSTTKKISLTKKEIIQAINTEPLGARETWATAAPAKKGCKVCAVGAVLRFAGGNRASVKKMLQQNESDFISNCEQNVGGNFNYFYTHWDTPVNDETVFAVQSTSGPLSALSSYYEALKSKGTRLPKIRKTLANYVQNNFPARTEITVSL